MREVAERVLRWHGGGRAGVLVRVAEVRGMSAQWPVEAMAVAAEERVGAVLAGAADGALAAVLQEAELHAAGFRDVDVPVGDAEAVAAGLACGGAARVVAQPTTDVPDGAWAALARREPVLLVTELDGEAPGRTSWAGAEEAGGPAARDPAVREVARSGVDRRQVVVLSTGASALAVAVRPVPRLVVLGEGHLADALRAVAGVLGWTTTVVGDGGAAAEAEAGEAMAGAGRSDAVVVLSHDVPLSSAVLARALEQGVGYVGALGSRGTQAARRAELLARGLPAERVDLVRGPAGLDLGSRTPAEVAVAILAEAMAVRAGTDPVPLRDRPGPVHAD